MADSCCPYSFNGVVLNDSTPDVDRLVLGEDGVTGLDGAPIRAEIDDEGQGDGGIVHLPKFFGARIITFKGFVDIRSVAKGMNDPYFTALNTVEAAVIAALEGALNTPSALTWTPTGLSGKSITCTYGNTGGEITFSGPMLAKEFEFTLVAEDPTIA
jgi:hypothetical protein